MEKGFYHPNIGYWQTLTAPTEAQRQEYPSGTTEVPLKPGEFFEWDGAQWVATTPPPIPPEQTEALRKAAYQAEADPLFFKYQRGEATREEWLAKVDEIRTRYPE